MRRYRTMVLVVLAASAAGAVVACTLNPQPLPPDAFSDEGRSSDASAADSGSFENPATPPADAGGTGKDSDADAAGDAGDAGDAADADGG